MIERIPTNKLQATLNRIATPVTIAWPLRNRRKPRLAQAAPKRDEPKRAQVERMPTQVQQWLNGARLAIGWAVILLLVGVGISVYLQQVSETAIIGRSAQQLDFEAQRMRFRNNQLRQQIAAAAALDRLQQRTEQLGSEYVAADPEKVEYITVIIVPEATPVVEEPTVQRLPAKTIQDALWQLVSEAVSRLGRGESRGQ